MHEVSTTCCSKNIDIRNLITVGHPFGTLMPNSLKSDLPLIITTWQEPSGSGKVFPYSEKVLDAPVPITPTSTSTPPVKTEEHSGGISPSVRNIIIAVALIMGLPVIVMGLYNVCRKEG